jgi:riboflavin synthase
MFTGLVQATGKVYSLEMLASGATRLALESPLLATAELGASIAVNGCCLTATSVQRNVATFDLLAETLRLTNLGDLKVGSLVNLEPSLRPTDRMGGHFVTGHRRLWLSRLFRGRWC